MKNLKFNASEMLKRAELKTVFGGNLTELSEDEGDGPCGYTDNDGVVRCGISRATAASLHAMSEGSNWCCNSCSTTSYCG